MKKKYRSTFMFSALIAAVTITAGSCSKKVIKSEGEKKAGSYETSVKDNEKEAAITGKVPDEILKFTGRYDLTVPGFKGRLILHYDRKGGRYSGEIIFPEWGNNISQPLKDLSVKEGNIYFIRSVETAEEMKKYGSSRYFSQKYYGKFSLDGSEIKGEFAESGSITNWRAKR